MSVTHADCKLAHLYNVLDFNRRCILVYAYCFVLKKALMRISLDIPMCAKVQLYPASNRSYITKSTGMFCVCQVLCKHSLD